jgi:hypothetical protein
VGVRAVEQLAPVVVVDLRVVGGGVHLGLLIWLLR